MSNLEKWLLLAACLTSITCKQNVIAPADQLSDPSIKPAVIYTYPARNSTGPFDNFSTTITVRFNKLMDLTSLQHAVRFFSLLGDIKEDTGRASSQSGEVASVSPVMTNPNIRFLWRIGQMYTLRIENTARDINGNNLIPPFSMTIKPEPYFRVKSMYPVGGNGIVPLGTQIQLYFNGFVDTTIFSSITITPALTGTWRFGSFYPAGVDSSSIYLQGGGCGPARIIPSPLQVGHTIRTGTRCLMDLGHRSQRKTSWLISLARQMEIQLFLRLRMSRSFSTRMSIQEAFEARFP